ncbi:hypothetical protein DRJ17_03560 [Candidatus Woesearchaeota archaeon]|nr:MAG: hypothetical protein DRJ17_03560 [Candidatus Woesearchaeota archaeon]
MPKASKVAVLRTTPKTVLEDYSKLLDLAKYKHKLKPSKDLILKLNLSWSLYFPACSTQPWQLAGVLNKLKKDKFKKLYPVENRTVVTDVRKGERGNRWKPILSKADLKLIDLTTVKWINYKLNDSIALHHIFGDTYKIPEMFIGKNIMHLPTMKCVHGDTLISTSRGLIRIKDMFGKPNLEKKEEKKSFKNRVLTFVGTKQKRTKYVKAIVWRNKSKGKIYKIRLKTGKEVIVSAEHPFLTQEGWVKAKKLNKKQHKIAVLREISSFRERRIKINLKKIKIKKSHNKITYPKRSSPELCRWIAYIVSEGSIENRKNKNYAIHFTNYSDELLSDFKRITKDIFGLKFRSKRSNKHELFVHSKQLVDVLKQLGVLLNNKKQIPSFIYSCTKEEIVNFLVTYIDCDGSIIPKSRQINITTTNENDAKLMQLLFQRIGVVAFSKKRKQHKYKDVFTLSIYADDIIKLNKLKPEFRKSKNKKKLHELLENINKRKNDFTTNYDFIPIHKEKIVHFFEKLPKLSNPFDRRARGNRFWQSLIYYKKRIPRKSFRYLVNALRYKLILLGNYNPDDFSYLDFLLDNALIWEDIVEITNIEKKTDLYDITVLEKSHNFIGNGILLHNTHGHTVMTGAIKNAFGGLVTTRRHHCHKMIHEVLVDILKIQKDIHPNLFAVMDGTVAGNGKGPRTMLPVTANLILASEDQAAIDAVAAKLMGFDPMKIKFLKLAHDQGLGTADLRQIDVVGDSIKNINLRFKTFKSPVIFFDQLFRKRLRFAEHLFFHTPLFRMFIFASEFYHDKLWYPTVGKLRIGKFNKTPWGKLFLSYKANPKIKLTTPTAKQ